MKKFFLYLILLLIFACSNSNEPIDDSFEEIIPLKTGNFWMYEHHTLNPDGTTSSISAFDMGYIIDDSLAVNLDGKQVIAKKISRYDHNSNWISPEGLYLYNSKDGTFLLGSIDTIETKTYSDLLFANSKTVGESNVSHLFYNDNRGTGYKYDTTSTYTLIAIDSLIITQLGNFRCNVYHCRIQALPTPTVFYDYYYFIKPTLGIVLLERKVNYPPDNNKIWISKEYLINYQVN